MEITLGYVICVEWSINNYQPSFIVKKNLSLYNVYVSIVFQDFKVSYPLFVSTIVLIHCVALVSGILLTYGAYKEEKNYLIPW